MSSLRDRLAAAAATPTSGTPTTTSSAAPAGAAPNGAASTASSGSAGDAASGGPTTPGFGTPPKPAQPAANAGKSLKKLGSQSDRIEELKASVHGRAAQAARPAALRRQHGPARAGARVRAALLDVLGPPGPSAERRRPHSDHPGDQRRHPRLRTDRALPARPGRLRGHGQRPRATSGSSASGQLVAADAAFADEAHLRRIIDKIVSRIGRRVDESSPMVDARLPDGSRVNAVIPPLAIDGSALTIRKFAADPLTVARPDQVRLAHPADRRLPRRLRPRPAQHHRLRQHRRRQDDDAQRAVVVHPRRRAHRHHRGRRRAPAARRSTSCASSPARPTSRARARSTIRDLVKNSLRMRPDRIIVGEVRDASALDMLQAMNTGHDGSICTVHSNGPRDTLARAWRRWC